MAVNCPSTIVDENTVFTFLAPNEVYTGDLANQNDVDYYRYEMYENETMTFTIRVFPNDLNPITLELTLFRMTGEETAVQVGVSNMNQFYNQFNYDGVPGEYRFCIKSFYDVDYELEVEFTDYPFTLFPSCDAYHGGYQPSWDFAKTASTCDSQVFYQLLSGNLPPGLELQSSGWIHGTPEELDCSLSEDSPPSFTWHEPLEEGGFARVAVTCDFHIVIRAALVESPGTFADRAFQVCVVNNWSYDRDSFLAGMENFEHKKYTTVQVLGEPLPADNAAPADALCEPCEEPEEPPRLTPIEIQALCEMCQIDEEFADLIEINTDGLCVPCEEPEEFTGIQLVAIESPYCEPCPEPEEQEGLRPIPEMCPCTDEEGEVITQARVFYEDIPDYCAGDFVTRMNNEKVCTGPITCPARSPLYHTEPIEEQPKIPNICGDTCN